MKKQWIAMEHYRMHSVERWPDGPKKEAALAAIRSSLASLSFNQENTAPECQVCQARRRESTVVEIDARRVAA